MKIGKVIFLVLSGLALSVSFAVEAKLADFAHFPPIPAKSTPARTLDFPTGAKFGGIAWQDRADYDFDEEAHVVNKNAIGTIKVPANKFVGYFPNHVFIQNPHALDKLPPDSFDYLQFRYIVLQDEDEGRGDPALASLGRFTSIRILDADKAEIGDRGLECLSRLPNLQFVTLFSTGAEGKFLKNFASAKQIVGLNFANTQLKPIYLDTLKTFPKLYFVNLGRLHLKSTDLCKMGVMPSLGFLDISSNPDLDDSCVPYLMTSMPKLLRLDIRKTGISKAGVKKLQSKYPKVVTSYVQGDMQRATRSSGNRARNSVRENEIETIFGPMSRGRGL
jgi:hypothetical protein